MCYPIRQKDTGHTTENRKVSPQNFKWKLWNKKGTLILADKILHFPCLSQLDKPEPCFLPWAPSAGSAAIQIMSLSNSIDIPSVKTSASVSLLVVFDTRHRKQRLSRDISRKFPKYLIKIHLDPNTKQQLLLWGGGGQNQTQTFTYALKTFKREVQF